MSQLDSTRVDAKNNSARKDEPMIHDRRLALGSFNGDTQ